VFKPSKMIYTLLNAFKAIIRTLPFIGIDANNIPPYIYLFSTLLIFNDVAKKHGGKIMSFYNNFYNTLSLPDTKIWNGWKDTAKILTIMFLCLTGVKDIGGFNWHETLQSFAVSADSGYFEDNKEPKARSGIEFLAAAPNNLFFMFFKIIIFILYWIFKFYVAIQMIPFALFIAVIYFTYTVFFAISNNCDSECNYSNKVELIDRIIYTRLYDVPKVLEGKDWPLYIFKTVCWLLMVFMVELLTIWTMSKGLTKITDSIHGSNADGLRLFLITIYSCIFCLIGLWCFYKFKIKLPIMETFYSKERDDTSPPSKPDEKHDIYKVKTGEKDGVDEYGNAVKIPIEIFNKSKYLKDMNNYKKYLKIKAAPDKRFTLERKTNCDTYEILTENKPFRIILGSDILNKIMIKEEIEKKKKLTEENKDKPSFSEKWSGKILGTIGNFGDRLLQKGQNIMESIERSKEDEKDNPTLFTAVKDIGKFVSNPPIDNIKEKGSAGFTATSSALNSAVGAVSRSMKNSAALLKENITDNFSSLFKKN
jgi:hypothetical protein